MRTSRRNATIAAATGSLCAFAHKRQKMMFVEVDCVTANEAKK